MATKTNLWSKVRSGEVGLRLAHIRRALALIATTAGGWTLAWGMLLILQGLIPAGLVFGTKWIVDAVAGFVSTANGWGSVQQVVTPAAFMGGLLLIQQVVGSILSWIQSAQSEIVVDEVKERIHEKAALVEYPFYESPSYYDRLEQANTKAGTHTLGLLRNVGTLVQGSVTFVSIAAILTHYSIWLPLVLFVSTAPALLVVVSFNRKYHGWWKRRTADHRWASYFDALLTRQIPAAEVRTLGLGDLFRNRYRDLRRRLRSEKLSILRSQAIATAAASVIALAATGGAMAWMVWRAAAGRATLGDIALFYQAFNQGQSIARGLLNSVGQIYANTLFLEDLFGFLDQKVQADSPAAGVDVPTGLESGISFENVTFSYPGVDHPALSDFTLHIPAGSIVAVVGENGAGKSTITKLLLRLYDLENGRIAIDGVDVRDIGVEALRRQISMMFQFPVKYQASVAENIAYGDLERFEDRDRIGIASREAGAERFIQALPQGLDTLLGRMFEGGMELSGGEWQRIALARAFLRQAPIIVLDEPTNFMDAWAEAEWLQRFRQLASGKSSLIITHRFTTAMQADIIHVMKGGRIVESGSHDELLRIGGMYATSWRQQMAASSSKSAEEPRLRAIGT